MIGTKLQDLKSGPKQVKVAITVSQTVLLWCFWKVLYLNSTSPLGKCCKVCVGGGGVGFESGRVEGGGKVSWYHPCEVCVGPYPLFPPVWEQCMK